MSIVLPIVIPKRHKQPESILEPGAGKGAFLGPLRKRYPTAEISALDIEPSFGPWGKANNSYEHDFLKWSIQHDLIIGNPPYTLALAFVKKAIELSPVVIFLVRQGFLASQKRNAFFRMNQPSDVFIISHRPSFTPDGQTDTADYCWVCWSDDRPRDPGTSILHWLPTVSKEKRK